MTRRRVRLGEHYSRVTFCREVGALRVWEFAHAPGGRIPDHQHERAHLLVVLAGAFGQRTRTDEAHYRAGDAVLHPRGVLHSNTIGEEGARTLAIEFEADDLPRLMPSAFSRLGRDMVVQGAPAKALAMAVRGAQAELEETVRTLLARMANSESEPAWIAAVKAELDRVLSGEPDVGKLAAAAGRHPAHMMREFRRRVGVPIGEYARARRIARACEALRATDVALSHIAASHGFADQSHFARTFKRFTNMTPDAYRRAHR